MDEKLENLVALLQPPSGNPAPPPPAPQATRRWRRAIIPAIVILLVGTGALGWIVWSSSPLLTATAPPAAPVSPPPESERPAVAADTAPEPVETAPESQQEETPPVAAGIEPPAPAEVPPEQPAPAAAAPAPPEPRAAGREEPAWLRYSMPAAPSGRRPRIAVVIEDLGLDKKRTERAIVLPGAVTLSFLAYASDLRRQTRLAHEAGHELLLHVPMEPIDPSVGTGSHMLEAASNRDEILRRLRWDLGRFEGYIGISNQMGSRFTTDARVMTPVIEELKARGLLFLDSRTAAGSKGVDLAKRLGVPRASRDVFLDNEVNLKAIEAQLLEVEEVARRRGTAIAIGHPHETTLAALAAWLPKLEAKGLVLVPVSSVVKRRMAAGGTG